ncbi:hypothetical protein C8F04DRAFT_1252138 [Mycena alexandri]|uniref:Uncharacterized protein n=1 Tax=Mycena alexandri TaxID=1745969 RepID=A0AAD6T953_9AGAR|nr:hypothetical protein C8F04DRAFT_1252138 [Mycena alexandri]
MATIPDFSGNRLDPKKLTAEDFMKKCGLYFRDRNITDIARQLLDVGDHFEHNSPADRWFKSIPDTDPRKATWPAFRAAFETRFQVAAPPPTPTAQLQAVLAGMRIGVEELAKGTVLVNGVRVPVLRDFAVRVNDVVTEANAGAEQGAALWLFYEGLEPWLRGAVGSIPLTWDNMVAALIDVPLHAVDAAVAAHKEKLRVESKMDDVLRKIAAMRVVPVAYQASAPGPAPAAGGAAGPAPPRVAATGGGGTGDGAAGGGIQAGGGGGGAARGGGRGGGFGRRVPTEAEKTALRAVMAGTIARRAPATPEGQVQYNAQRAEWETRNGSVPAATLDVAATGYPLTPGTADPATGECWTCGYRELPVHRGDCRGHPELPPLERRFRSVCGSWLLPDRNIVGVNMVEEEVTQGVPWYGAEEDGANGQPGF